MKAWRAVIGLEVHAQLRTRTKLFCRCRASEGDSQNEHICPVCLGLPGALPVPNAEAVRLAVRGAIALECTVRPRSTWSRKSYFYPDLPKGYQITQEAEPLAVDGRLRIETPEGRPLWLGIQRVHLEEDAGKSTHGLGGGSRTGVDFNRCGHPLIEIVSRPEIHDPEHARRYVERLRAVLVACGICRGELETGAMRCDANVSLHREGEPWGERVEIKNLNSLRFLRRALAFEVERQRRLLEAGDAVVQETRTWDERAAETRPLRSKEDEPDYRYFPDPDLPPLEVPEPLRAAAGADLPELPHETLDRLVSDHGLRAQDAYRLTVDPRLADYFERVADAAGHGPDAAAWVLSELAGRARSAGKAPGDALVPAEHLGALAQRTRSGRLSRPAAKQVLDEMILSGRPPGEIIAERGLEPLEGRQELIELCQSVLDEHPAQVQQYRQGKGAVIGFLIGKVMAASGGRADPKRVRAELRGLLES